MASIMLNKPTQQMSDLYSHLQNAANIARNGNVEMLVRNALQQNPVLAQRYEMLMRQCGNASPTQVLNMLTQRYGIDLSQFGMPRP